MKIHNLIQGSPEWDAFRLIHNGASEAAAMLGLSPKVKRNELLHAKHTGIAREFSQWVQDNILAYGHAVEALARPLIEELIGEDLYPVTCSNEDEGGNLSASCDGLTMGYDTAFEHKQWNAALAESVRAGILPEEHMPQCMQILLITSAKRLIFAVSDGTRENFVYMEVRPDPEWFSRIRSGWAQFDRDLAEYVVPEAAHAVTAAPQEVLPALSVRVEGNLAVRSNLDAFGTVLRAFIDRMPREPETDQDFADTEAACKRLKEVEESLDAAENSALGSLDDVEQMRRTVATLRELARNTRLAGEKVVKVKKEEIRTNKVLAARKKFTEYVAALQVEVIGVRLDVQVPDFGAAIKSLRTLASIDNALDTAVANGKITASELAADLRGKLAWFNDNVAEDLRGLFRDLSSMMSMPAEHFQATVIARVQQHQQAQAARDDEIRKQEAEKLAAAQQPAAASTQPLPLSAGTISSQPAPAAFDPAPAIERRTGAPSLRLGQINERLSPISLSAEGLASLGFPHSATEKAAKLWHEAEFSKICDKLVEHINAAHRGSELLAA